MAYNILGSHEEKEYKYMKGCTQNQIQMNFVIILFTLSFFLLILPESTQGRYIMHRIAKKASLQFVFSYLQAIRWRYRFRAAMEIPDLARKHKHCNKM